MSMDFAVKMLDSMVDGNGHCGERGISYKQFDILSAFLDEGDEQDLGEWEGDYKTVYFWGIDYHGNVGPYHVVLNKHFRFHMGYNVVSIDLRPEGEYEAELEEERRLAELRDFSHSEWVAEPKKRIDLTLTLVNDYEYYGRGYTYYDDGVRHIYTFRDENGNCIVWKTASPLGMWDEDGKWVPATEEGVVTMRATVKEHGEYRGVKQTVVTRPKITAIR